MENTEHTDFSDTLFSECQHDLDRQIILGFDPLKHRGGCGDNCRDQNNKGAHHHSAGNIVRAAHKYENVGFRTDNKDRRGNRAIFYDLQSSHAALRKYFVTSGIPQHPDGLVKTDKKWDKRQVYIRQERVLEIYLELRGVHVPALELRFPKQEGKNADAEKYNYDLKENC